MPPMVAVHAWNFHTVAYFRSHWSAGFNGASGESENGNEWSVGNRKRLPAIWKVEYLTLFMRLFF